MEDACCLEPKLAAKLRGLWTRPEDMLNDSNFWQAFRLFGRTALITNMHVERLFAQIKQSVDMSDAFLERVRVNGYLSECLSQHLKAGGADPREEHAGAAIALGAPLEAAIPKEHRQSRAAPAWMMYVNTLDQDHQSRNPDAPRRSKQQRTSDQIKLKADFDALPEAEKARWAARAAEAHALKRMAAVQEARLPQVEPLEMPDAARPMGGLSGDGLPINQQAFLRAAAARADDSFRSWGRQARDEFQAAAFVQDSGKIPRGLRVTVRRACWQRHSGVCATKDSAIYDAICHTGSALAQYLWDGKHQFEWLRIILSEPERPDTVKSEGLFWCAYTRGSNPRASLFLAGDPPCKRRIFASAATSPSPPSAFSPPSSPLRVALSLLAPHPR
eukprot:5854419-Pyramimonas_sp.AAC.1